MKDCSTDDLNRILDQSLRGLDSEELTQNVSNEENIEQTVSEDKEIKTSLKMQSPFTAEFINIQKEVESSLSHESEDQESNILYNRKFTFHLQEKSMPYCFIWSRFTLIESSGLNQAFKSNFVIFKPKTKNSTKKQAIRQ